MRYFHVIAFKTTVGIIRIRAVTWRGGHVLSRVVDLLWTKFCTNNVQRCMSRVVDLLQQLKTFDKSAKQRPEWWTFKMNLFYKRAIQRPEWWTFVELLQCPEWWTWICKLIQLIFAKQCPEWWTFVDLLQCPEWWTWICKLVQLMCKTMSRVVDLWRIVTASRVADLWQFILGNVCWSPRVVGLSEGHTSFFGQFLSFEMLRNKWIKHVQVLKQWSCHKCHYCQ